jgi:lipopolysaccharide/colanic/teichoic acid biosynthesis glycosyltransferase
MRIVKWERLPQNMQTEEVRKYYEVLRKRRFSLFLKRVFDILLSLIMLVILSPFFLILAVAIKIDSRGPVFYRQERITQYGKKFRIFKFRTMVNDADKKGAHVTTSGDTRITKVGKFIRKTSIDELPQLINILKGDLSIVGPRPALPREVEQYSEYDAQRLYVTPGLTCYWQVKPQRNEIGFDEWMELDIKYIQERSFLTDWKIIFQTVGVVIGMGGR